MSMGLQDRRDVDFLVREVLGVDRLFGTKLYKEQGWETFEMICDQATRFANEQLEPANSIGDREGPKFDNGAVITPAVFKKLYKTYCEGGWLGLTEPEDHGGMGLPRVLGVQATAQLIGANVSFFTLPGLAHAASELLTEFGSPRQREIYLPKLFSGEWAGTMCLTEAGAGSDLGAMRAVAVPQPDGTFHISGTKTFITWGEHDLTENILYPVLARIEGDPAGTKGISLFMVSKVHLDEKGNLGQRNGVVCTGIEHKLGIHGSPTCTLVFGEGGPAVGELIGEPRQGVRAMFKMMNTARIAVGLQALGVAEAAYRYAQQYSLERVQGVAAENFRDPAAPRVAIVKHPDVRRMLLDMRATVEGIRALVGYTTFQYDLSLALEGREAEAADDLVALLTPLVKGYASEIAFDAVSTSIMVLGGHGYLRDHPLEQHLRDTVIARIYEGTTGIQAMDLVGRKLGAKGGAVMMQLLGLFDQTIAKAREVDLGGMADQVAEMRKQVGMSAMALGGRFMKGDIQGPLLQATPMMHLFGDAVTAWLHLEMAVTAKKVSNPSTFHQNKVVTARHFIQTAAGRVAWRAAGIAANDRAPLDFVFEGEEDL